MGWRRGANHARLIAVEWGVGCKGRGADHARLIALNPPPLVLISTAMTTASIAICGGSTLRLEINPTNQATGK